MELDEISKLIQAKSGMDASSVAEDIERRYDELGGLVTKQGAAHLLARQMGIELPNDRFQIKDIQPNSRNINIVGRITKVSPVTEFKRQDGSKGTVANIFITDSTGQIRVPLWNEQVQIAESCKIGDVVQVVNGLARQNNFGIEISIGKYGGIRKLDDVDMPPIQPKHDRVEIGSMKIGGAEIAGTVMQIFKGNFIYHSCPTCGTRTDGTCLKHGKVEPKASMVVSVLADDGTGDVRVVMFGDVAKEMCGVDAGKLSGMNVEERYQTVRNSMEGRDFVFTGRAKQGMYDRLELIAEKCKSLNAADEIKRLQNSKLVGE